jgi:GDP-mannose 6-dehydrogenase
MGLSFKEGTDDMRESPIVTLAERLIGKGLDLRIYDRNVKLASLVGANRDYILNHVPHIGRLLVDTPEILFEHAEAIVMATAEKDFGPIAARLGKGKQLIDLVGIWKNEEQVLSTQAQRYAGIAW